MIEPSPHQDTLIGNSAALGREVGARRLAFCQHAPQSIALYLFSYLGNFLLLRESVPRLLRNCPNNDK
jgi:hypothetical protein